MPSGISLELIIIESNRISACIVNCSISFRFLRGVIKRHEIHSSRELRRNSSWEEIEIERLSCSKNGVTVSECGSRRGEREEKCWIHRSFMRVKLSFRYSNLRVNSLKVELAEYFRERFLSFLSSRRRGLSRRNLRRIFTTEVNGEFNKEWIRSRFFLFFFFFFLAWRTVSRSRVTVPRFMARRRKLVVQLAFKYRDTTISNSSRATSRLSIMVSRRLNI